jgi:hypothetical protein
VGLAIRSLICNCPNRTAASLEGTDFQEIFNHRKGFTESVGQESMM